MSSRSINNNDSFTEDIEKYKTANTVDALFQNGDSNEEALSFATTLDDAQKNPY